MRSQDRNLFDQLGFVPTAYPSDLSATTTAASVDLSVLKGKGLRIRNMDTIESIRIAFGPDSATAITNAATGCVIDPGQMEILQPRGTDDFMAYRTIAGTASINYQPGF